MLWPWPRGWYHSASLSLSAPCVPHNVEAFTQCEDHLGSVSWALSDGAEAYTAVAVGQDGHTHMCATTNTTCTWNDLHCGEHYLVHVVAHHDLCESTPSNSTSIRMGESSEMLMVYKAMLSG